MKLWKKMVGLSLAVALIVSPLISATAADGVLPISAEEEQARIEYERTKAALETAKKTQQNAQTAYETAYASKEQVGIGLEQALTEERTLLGQAKELLAEVVETTIREADDAKAVTEQAESSVQAAKAEVTKAESSLSQKERQQLVAVAVETVNRNNAPDQETLEQARATLEEAETRLASVTQIKDSTESEAADATVTAERASAKASQSQELATRAENAEMSLNSAMSLRATTAERVKNAEVNLAQAQADLAIAEPIAEAARIRKEEKEAQFAEGAFGFYREHDQTQYSANGGYGGVGFAIYTLENTQYAYLTRKGDPHDATSLDNMLHALSYIRRCNEIRVSEGMSELLVDDRCMAVAQVKSNAISALNLRQHIADGVSMTNNLIWITPEEIEQGVDDPYNAWFYEEKEWWEQGVRGNDVGHYLNIIYGGSVTGYAMADYTENATWHYYTMVQTFSDRMRTLEYVDNLNALPRIYEYAACYKEDYESRGYEVTWDDIMYVPDTDNKIAESWAPAYTVDEYEADLRAYYAKVDPTEARAEYAAAVATLENAQARLADAQDALENGPTDLERAIQEEANAQAEYDQAVSALGGLTIAEARAIADADATASEEAAAKAEETRRVADEAAAAWAETAEWFEIARGTPEETIELWNKWVNAKAALDKANAELAEAKVVVEEKKQLQAEAEAAVETAQANYNKAIAKRKAAKALTADNLADGTVTAEGLTYLNDAMPELKEARKTRLELTEQVNDLSNQTIVLYEEYQAAVEAKTAAQNEFKAAEQAYLLLFNQKREYHVTEGNGQTYILGSGNDPIFTADMPMLLFHHVGVDNPSKMNTVEIISTDPEGPLQVRIVDCDQFTEGTHTVSIVGENGKAEGTFIVAKKADEPEIPDAPTPILYGDADRNGVVNAFDAVLVLDYDIGLAEESMIDLAAADVDGNGFVDAFDASVILEYDVGTVTKFPVDKK